MAFKNSLYDEDAMKRIAATPPTRLTQVRIHLIPYAIHPMNHLIVMILTYYRVITRVSKVVGKLLMMLQV